MSMKDLEEAFGLIEHNHDQADFDGPKSDKLLNKAEQRLGLLFPATYRTFLSRLGCGDIAGAEFYGVIKDDFENSAVPDAIWLTLRQRQIAQAPLSLIIVGSTDNGGYFALDSSVTSNDGENPVVEWWPGPKTQLAVAKDFGEFFLRSVREALGEYGEKGIGPASNG
jgi:antitoxin YobK